MKRIYFLVPNLELARKIVDELLLARIEERHIHVLAKRGTPLEDLPEASFLQKTDFIPAMERGLALGGATGLLAGLAAMAFPHIVIGGGAILAITLAGAGVGSWVASMVGMNVGNTQLKPFEEAIEKGEILMLVDVPKPRVDEISKLIQKHHPNVEFEGTEPTIPPFP